MHEHYLMQFLPDEIHLYVQRNKEIFLQEVARLNFIYIEAAHVYSSKLAYLDIYNGWNLQNYL